MKVTFIKVELIKFVATQNVRFSAGMVIAGITLTRDMRLIGALADDLKEAGRLINALSVEKIGKLYNGLCGHRRWAAIQALIAAEPDSVLVQGWLKEGIPCIVYEDLDHESRQRIINDQTSLQFLASEVFNYFRQGILAGRSWESLGAEQYAQIARITGSGMKLQQYRAITDADERRTMLKAWQNNFVNQYWRDIVAHPAYADMLLRQYMFQDGMPDVPEPTFTLTSAKWKEIKALIVAGDDAGIATMLAGKVPVVKRKLKSGTAVASFQALCKLNGTWVASVLEASWADCESVPAIVLLQNLEAGLKKYDANKAYYDAMSAAEVVAMLRG